MIQCALDPKLYTDSQNFIALVKWKLEAMTSLTGTKIEAPHSCHVLQLISLATCLKVMFGARTAPKESVCASCDERGM